MILNGKKVKDIKNGYIGLVRRKLTFNPLSWVSSSVRWWTDLWFNHAILFIREGSELYVIEAVEKGFIRCHWDVWSKKYDYIMEVKKPSNIPTDFDKRVQEIEGNPYDFFSLILIHPPYQFLRKIGLEQKWIGRKRRKASKFVYCSEAILKIYNRPEWWSGSSRRIYLDPFFKTI